MSSETEKRRSIRLPYNAPAFHMIDDIYYVVSRFVSSHLVTSEERHILIDTCMPDTGPRALWESVSTAAPSKITGTP